MTVELQSQRGIEPTPAGIPTLAWIVTLDDVPRLEPPSGPITVVAPHPDDETLGAGGVIAFAARRGQRVTIATVTDGEAAPVDLDGLAKIRTHEQQAALETLGAGDAPVHRLCLPDGAVSDRIESLTLALELLAGPGTTLIAPWRHDGHPDHEACAEAAARAARTTGARLLSYPIWAWDQRVELLPWSRLRRVDLPDDVAADKRRAIACHRSQLRPAAAPPVVPPHLEAHFSNPFEVFVA